MVSIEVAIIVKLRRKYANFPSRVVGDELPLTQLVFSYQS